MRVWKLEACADQERIGCRWGYALAATAEDAQVLGKVTSALPFHWVHEKAKLREDRCAAVAANETWAMDFVHDQLATGRKLRVLTIVDTFSRFSPVLDARFSYRGEDVVATLNRVCTEVGFPKTIRVDQGSEFISRDLDLWAYHHGVILDFARPGV